MSRVSTQLDQVKRSAARKARPSRQRRRRDLLASISNDPLLADAAAADSATAEFPFEMDFSRLPISPAAAGVLPDALPTAPELPLALTVPEELPVPETVAAATQLVEEPRISDAKSAVLTPSPDIKPEPELAIETGAAEKPLVAQVAEASAVPAPEPAESANLSESEEVASKETSEADQEVVEESKSAQPLTTAATGSASATDADPSIGSSSGTVQARPPATLEEQPEGAVGKPRRDQATAEEGRSPESAMTPGIAAPTSPEEDPQFQAFVATASKVAERQASHASAKTKSAEAQAAARGPQNEVASQAAAAQVGTMDVQQPKAFDRQAFRTALMQKIAEITPQNLEDVDEFKDRGTAGKIEEGVTAEVQQGKAAAQSNIQQATAAPPDPSAAQPKPVAELPPTEAGPKPGDIGAAQAAPKPKTDAEVSLEAGSTRLDQQMTEAGITNEQLANSNEPQFVTALEAKNTAQTNAREAPVAYRQEEAGILGQAQSDAVSFTGIQTQGMHATRQDQFSQIVSQQQATKSQDETKRAEVATLFETIYEETKQKVEARLQKLDEDVHRIFDQGAAQAATAFESYVETKMDAYKDERYSGAGAVLWVKDKLLGLPDEVQEFYKQGKDKYIADMSVVIDLVANTVETGLNETTALIDDGSRRVKEQLAALPDHLKKYGQEAAGRIQGKFESLGESVSQRQTQLIDSLAQKYVAKLGEVDARIEQMKQADRGFVDQAFDAMQGVIETIRQLKETLLSIVGQAEAVIGSILRDPIGFIGMVAQGIGQGLKNFVTNVAKHLKQGLMGWLFGALSAAGIQIPESFDLQGIFSLVMQVLGLTYQAIRARAVKLVGEPTVARLEQVSEIFQVLVRDGIGGAWQFIAERLGDLKTVVLAGIQDFVIGKIITSGITWILSLLNPAAAFIKAVKAIIDIVKFFIQRAAQIQSLVSAIIESLGAIASGAVGAVAESIENALARAVPVVISFLAALLGIGGISDKIRQIIEKLKQPIMKAIDWLIAKAMQLLRSAGRLIGIGKKESTKTDQPAVATGATVQQSFMMDKESHTITARGTNDGFKITIASAVEVELQVALARALAEVNAKPKFPGKSRIRKQLETALRQADYNLILADWQRLNQPGRWPDFLHKRVLAIASSLNSLGNEGISALDDLFATLKRNNGKYGHIPDPPNIDFRLPFTPTQRITILAENKKQNGGIITSDQSGIALDDTLTANAPSKPNIDHIFPRSAGGSNSYSNAQVLARDENAAKLAQIQSPLAFVQKPKAPNKPVTILRKKQHLTE